ncbi:MAG: excisionase family DNA-binding protein [Candidatus Omnitrophica bacterium]|nr:excisionase family DNA-binding protein [Candidatus Omnitrophota bacterium]
MDKLLTLEELSYYLGVKEDRLVKLIEKGVISGYQIGGEFLRFRKDQIDAIRHEINSRVRDSDRITVKEHRKSLTNKRKVVGEKDNFFDRIADFIYFKDFYIITGVIIWLLCFFILKELS